MFAIRLQMMVTILFSSMFINNPSIISMYKDSLCSNLKIASLLESIYNFINCYRNLCGLLKFSTYNNYAVKKSEMDDVLKRPRSVLSLRLHWRTFTLESAVNISEVPSSMDLWNCSCHINLLSIYEEVKEKVDGGHSLFRLY